MNSHVLFVLGNMAVEKLGEKSISAVSQEEITKAYSDLLTDVNKCLQLCRSLETKRTYREMVSDWAVGQRGNIPRLIILMVDLKKEVEKGLSLFTTLLRKLNALKLISRLNDNSSDYVSENLKHHGSILTDIYVRFCEAVSSLQNVGIIRCGKIIKTIDKDLGLGCASLADVGFMVLAPKVGIAYYLSWVGYSLVRNDGKKRGSEYTELQSLFESLSDPIMMSTLQTAHFTIENLIKDLDVLTTKCEAKEKKIKSISFEKNSVQGAIKATKIFYNTEREELQELVSTQPDMNEDTKKKIAKRAAVRNCKTFLTGKLQYSNTEADQFINELQN